MYPLPNPLGKDLAGRVRKPLYFVQVVVIQSLPQWPERVSDVGEVKNPSRLGTHLTSNVKFDTEGVAVKTPALMPWRYIRKVCAPPRS